MCALHKDRTAVRKELKRSLMAFLKLSSEDLSGTTLTAAELAPSALFDFVFELLCYKEHGEEWQT